MLKKISEVQEERGVSVRGEIFKILETPQFLVYTLSDETGIIDVSSEAHFAVGDAIEASGNTRFRGNFLQLYAESAKKLEGEEAHALKERVANELDKEAEPFDAVPLFQDAIMEALAPLIRGSAKRIRCAVLTFRPILIRYHSDADGICGGISLMLAIKKLIGEERRPFYLFQNNSAIYKTADALRDINTLRNLNPATREPLVLLVDFGVNPDSEGAIAILKGAGFEVLAVDHHPTPSTPKGIDSLVSPWSANGTSDYTAGMLACEVAKRVEKIDVEELQRISLTGDKSKLSTPTDELKKKATTLDFLATYSKFPNTLEFYYSVLLNDTLLTSIYAQATERMERSKEIAKEFVTDKTFPNGIRCIFVRLDRAVKKGEFPSKGKACGKIHEELAENESGPLVTVGYGGHFITVRANEVARSRGFSANKIIANIKEEYKNALESGGGHDVAASLKINKGFGKLVLEEFVKQIKAL
ncbi:MAG: DHH family phosphoesterase [Candidatus Micrarchaeota archaeon]